MASGVVGGERRGAVCGEVGRMPRCGGGEGGLKEEGIVTIRIKTHVRMSLVKVNNAMPLTHLYILKHSWPLQTWS